MPVFFKVHWRQKRMSVETEFKQLWRAASSDLKVSPHTFIPPKQRAMEDPIAMLEANQLAAADNISMHPHAPSLTKFLLE